ncbi:MAG: hypothetical protein K8U03_07935 [Planctomycetia bacterium]|nr:hypothetical protein [Planctomycetia bacterium]
MKVSLRSLLCTVGMLLAGINVAQAEEVRLAPTFTAFEAPARDEIVLTSHDCSADNLGSCEKSCAPQRHVGRDFFVCKDRCAGIIAGTETVFLRPYASGGNLDNGPGSAQMNFNPSQRYWLGYQSADGLGARIRYWEFDRGATSGGVVGGAGPTGLGVEFRNLDVEMTQAVDFKRWNLLFSGGLRYQEMGFNTATTTNIFDVGFDGVGLTFAGQASRDLNSSGSLRMTMGGRWSAIYGNTKVAFTTIGFPAFPVAANDDLVNVLELNIGPQYRRLLSNGSYLTAGVGVEAQHYSNSTFGDIGFVGFGTSIGITR